jgi:hypothetical protein
MSSSSETHRQLDNGQTRHLKRRYPKDSHSRKVGKSHRTSLVANGPFGIQEAAEGRGGWNGWVPTAVPH